MSAAQSLAKADRISERVWRAGGCHCGAVRFEAELPAKRWSRPQSCNCSMCEKAGFVHLIVPGEPLLRLVVRRGER